MSKLWRISQQTNSDYDTYDSAVIVADSPEDARRIHPGGDLYQRHGDANWWEGDRPFSNTWCSDPEQVEAELIGEATANLKPNTVICASFNAG